MLPSISELLAHPRVREAVGRIHDSTLAQRAASFLEELRANLAQRTEGWDGPSQTHLVERFVRRLFGQTPGAAAVINATGRVLGDPDLVVPLAEPVLHAWLETGTEYAQASEIGAHRQLEIARYCRAEAVAAFASYEGAALALLSAYATSGTALVLGGDHGLAAWPRWATLAARAGVALRAVAPQEAIGASPNPRTPWIVLRRPRAAASCEGPPDGELVWLRDVAQRAAACGALLVDAAPSAGLLDPGQFGWPAVATIPQRLEAGVDLTLTSGDGLLGGPAAGLLAGRLSALTPIGQHPLTAALAASPGVWAALGAATALAARPEQAVHQSPVWQLLAAPEANLRFRSERLAAVLGASAEASRATAVPLESVVLEDVDGPLRGPSWGVALDPARRSAADLAVWLAGRTPAIKARTAGNQLVLDLRSVFARWDHQLPALFGEASGVQESTASAAEA